MKFQFKISKLTVFIIGSLVLSISFVGAQQGRKAASAPAARASKVLRLQKFSGLKNGNLVKTPEYKTNVNRGITPAKYWYRLAISYDTAPDWIDEITVRYYAMSLTKVDGAKAYTIFKTSVRYVDIEAGSKHLSVAYLHPKAIDRYGNLVAVAVEILVSGTVVAEDSAVKGKGIPKDWWKNATVTESQSVTVKDGYLRSKADTPFAFINVDDYEFAK